MAHFASFFVLLYSAKLSFLNLLTEKAKSLGESKKFDSVDSGDLAAPGRRIDGNIQMSLLPEARRTVLIFFSRFGHCLLLYNQSCV